MYIETVTLTVTLRKYTSKLQSVHAIQMAMFFLMYKLLFFSQCLLSESPIIASELRVAPVPAAEKPLSLIWAKFSYIIKHRS